MRHVIIGTGPAGVVAAETIRQHAALDDILLIGNEPDPPYSRAALPHLLMGAANEPATWLRKDPHHFDSLRIEQRRGTVDSVDSRARKLIMQGGDTIAFDQLLIATGSRAVRPHIPGIDSLGVHTCWTLDDARSIIKLARPRARVILIGAGFVGCLLMEALAARRVQLTVIEKRDRMMPHMLGPGAGSMISQWWERMGVRVHTSTRVTAIEPGQPLTVRLSNGARLQADLIVCATGVQPNVDFLQGSGIRYLQGVLVDATMQTNVPGIYAAGDCAEAYDEESGRTLISGVQANAADQAYCAGLNMVGRHAFQRAVRQVNVLDTMGLAAGSFGQWRGVSGGQWVEFNDKRNFKYLRLEFSDDVLVGSNAVGLPEHSGVLQDLIRHRVALGEWKDRLMQDPTLLREAHQACVKSRHAGRGSYSS
jgi:NAD(P)H-nitrite reductase large subunit